MEIHSCASSAPDIGMTMEPLARAAAPYLASISFTHGNSPGEGGAACDADRGDTQPEMRLTSRVDIVCPLLNAGTNKRLAVKQEGPCCCDADLGLPHNAVQPSRIRHYAEGSFELGIDRIELLGYRLKLRGAAAANCPSQAGRVFCEVLGDESASKARGAIWERGTRH